jgi:hypothetical protein
MVRQKIIKASGNYRLLRKRLKNKPDKNMSSDLAL